ncbi:DUF6233 domain-containing protein [Streptomyces sp. NBC_01363]|uniref:DUF6233 domain-containing protein n=1 Tax=Streptomyces sp. NBC_01363 TaxID=2903840 RepID=UPI00225488FC|nr:DUF6233 domain-containing protein [Streptomyces sp. NBC_01363]MCX4734557.1 DUF6233 domain-containing protein [Streptomyces sp. NBC_01363]
MTTSSAPEPVPVPIRVLLPGDQEVVAHLWSRRQAPDGWLYEVGLPSYRNGPGDSVEPAEYRVWVRAPEHVRPVGGVSYDAVPTEYLEPPSLVQQALGPRRPPGWVLAKVGGRGPGQGVVHAVDCEEAPAGAPVLTLDRALDAAQHPGTRLCSLCGAAAELDPLLNGFDQGFGEN